jgi:hemerythrin superfamily protein
MDALELLQQDHRTVKELLHMATESDDPKKQRQLFREIRTELETHTRLEETIFYPAMAEHEELKEMVLESIEEHKRVKTLLRDRAVYRQAKVAAKNSRQS